MGRKAKHHYIPKCYLKGFTNGGENTSQYWAVPTNNNEPFTTNPNDSCSKRDYYTVDLDNALVVEDFYAETIEPKISKAIRHIAAHLSLPPKEEMRHLILLLATLYLRIPSFRESLEMPMRRTKEIAESMSIRVSNMEEFEYTKTDIIKSELRLIDSIQESLSKKYYQLHVIDDESANFITSDRPFLLSHPKGGNGFYFGLNTPDIEICVPITSKAVLIARNEEMNEGTFLAASELVGLTNKKITLTADKFFFTKNNEFLLVDNEFSVFKHKISTNKQQQRTDKSVT